MGNDILDGGIGWDFVDYRYATVGVTVSLALAGLQVTGGAGSDTLISIENLYGSSFADTLPGVHRPMALGFKTDEIRRVLSIEQ